MKHTLLFFIAAVLFTVNILAQRTNNKRIKRNKTTTHASVNKNFVPCNKLLNTDKWKRVSKFRFESGFLRLAVEWKNNEYLLLEMDGKKRVLAREKQYHKISQAIINLTITNVTQSM